MFLRVALVLVILLTGLPAKAQEPELDALLHEIETRLQNHVDYSSFSASLVSTLKQMDKHWKAKRTLDVRKNVLRQNGRNIEELIEATRTKKGVTKDVTEEYRKLDEKARKRESKQRRKKKKDDARGSPTRT